MDGKNDELSSFMHSLSHDLKNILHNIQGYVDLMDDDGNPEYLEGISRLVKKARLTIQEYVRLADNGELTKRPS